MKQRESKIEGDLRYRQAFIGNIRKIINYFDLKPNFFKKITTLKYFSKSVNHKYLTR